MSFDNYNSFDINPSHNISNPRETFGKDSNVFLFLYMMILLLVSTTITIGIREYRRSLPYLKINIILLLNYYLVEVFNSACGLLVNINTVVRDCINTMKKTWDFNFNLYQSFRRLGHTYNT